MAPRRPGHDGQTVNGRDIGLFHARRGRPNRGGGRRSGGGGRKGRKSGGGGGGGGGGNQAPKTAEEKKQSKHASRLVDETPQRLVVSDKSVAFIDAAVRRDEEGLNSNASSRPPINFQRRPLFNSARRAEDGAPAGGMSAGGVPLGRGGDLMDMEVGAKPLVREAAEDTLRVIEGNAVDGAATGKLAANRRKLPAWLSREEMIRTVADNAVTVVSGETGCGKSTQVPQFLLDGLKGLLDAPSARGGGRGASSSATVVCTQPRRISAISVAERVASERGEPVGKSVGYAIRLETRACAATRLLFCTTGVLLRRLQDDHSLDGVKAIIVDEIHERSLETDLLLVLLRRLLRSGARSSLRVVLMSATLNAAAFASYFGDDTPIISIPGKVFPVARYYLEHAVERVRCT